MKRILFLFIIAIAAFNAKADIITPQPSSTPAPVTLEQKESQQKAVIKSAINVQYRALTQSITALFNMVWNNPAGLTPQQVFDSFGTDCGQLHGLFALFTTALNTAKAGSITLVEPKTVTVSPDQSCTVSE